MPAEGACGRFDGLETLVDVSSRCDRNAKFGGITVSDAQRLKELEQENSKLKRLVAESMLDNAALKDLLSRN